MRKVIPLFGSFVTGAVCMFLLLTGIQTSTSAEAAGSIINAPNMIPVVPLLGRNWTTLTLRAGAIQQLDGFECRECKFEDATFTYGGGGFHLEEGDFVGPRHLILTGAANNTARLLIALGFVRREMTPNPIENRQKLYISNIVDTQPVTLTLLSVTR
ncbi:MAG: hypothetical protein ACLQDV_25600 [Candidatus Binataceae bacterium]